MRTQIQRVDGRLADAWRHPDGGAIGTGMSSRVAQHVLARVAPTVVE